MNLTKTVSFEDTNSSYRIGDLARMFSVTVRTIRYYEELGLLEAEDRGGSEHRRYPARNAIYLKRIQQLKDYGLTLSEIAELFALARQDRSGELVRQGLAGKYRAKLLEAQKRRDALDRHMDELSWHIDQLEKVGDFNQCPGAACAACAWSERCDVRLLLGEGIGNNP